MNNIKVIYSRRLLVHLPAPTQITQIMKHDIQIKKLGGHSWFIYQLLMTLINILATITS